jgi:hypothetical protein
LSGVAAAREKSRVLRLGLHAFGDDVQPEHDAQFDAGFDDRAGRRFCGDVAERRRDPP